MWGSADGPGTGISIHLMEGTLPISVVIVVKNAEQSIESCLISVTGENPAEIIVVDGNSNDRTVDLARKYTNRIYSDSGMGLSVARRIGAQQAREKYIAYVDSDVSLAHGTLRALLQELECDKLAGIAARVRPTTTTSYWQWASQEHSDILINEGGFHLLGSLLERDVVLLIDFDPFIHGGEDQDFTLRARHEGYRLETSSHTFVNHASPPSFCGLAGRLWRYGDDIPRWAWKHGVLSFRHWPLLTALYRIGFCLTALRIRLIPYFILVGLVESAGAAWGFLQLVLLRRTREDLPRVRWL
jgi:glycosyltransferase involved in cell wall biosynthesis